MNKKELEKYYFPNAKIIRIKNRYLKRIIGIIRIENLIVNNESISLDDRLKIQDNIELRIKNYLTDNFDILFDMFFSYNLYNINFLVEIILQSIYAYLYINDERFNFDIFLSKKSLLYLNGEYPINILDWKNNNKLTILHQCEIYNKIYEIIKNET